MEALKSKLVKVCDERVFSKPKIKPGFKIYRVRGLNIKQLRSIMENRNFSVYFYFVNPL